MSNLGDGHGGPYDSDNLEGQLSCENVTTCTGEISSEKWSSSMIGE